MSKYFSFPVTRAALTVRRYAAFRASSGSDIVRLKKEISGPIKSAVITVPTPGINPSAKPTATQIRSLMIRMARKGRIRPKSFGFRSAIWSGIASYVETPRSAV